MDGCAVLVTYASRSGSTAEIAAAIGDGLDRAGLHATVLPVDSVASLEPYDAFIVGSALYMGTWRATAIEFVLQHKSALSSRPIWLFSSGPVEPRPEGAEMLPPIQVARLAARLGAREHVIFGGRLAPQDVMAYREAMGTTSQPGDYRDFGEIARWAERIAGELRDEVADRR